MVISKVIVYGYTFSLSLLEALRGLVTADFAEMYTYAVCMLVKSGVLKCTVVTPCLESFLEIHILYIKNSKCDIIKRQNSLICF